jgi:cation:H+ antiporter
MPDWYLQPPLYLAAIFLLVGFLGLIKGADFLVKGAVVIARRFKMSPAVVGATVVAFGTSLPELVVSVGSNLKAISEGLGDNPDGPAAIAMGNVVGSNIFNIGGILGLSALMSPLVIPADTRKRDFPIMLGALVILLFFCFWGEPTKIDRWEAGLLFLGLMMFTLYAIQTGKIDESEIPEVDEKDSMLKSFGIIFVGILLLTLGGDMSLTGAISVSRWFGLSERVIGLTVMAVGTSLPELATSLQAVRNGQHDIAVANVIGSNIFNVFCIIGLSGLLLPLPIPLAMLHWDLWWMAGFSFILALPLFMGWKLGKPMGFLLVGGLVTYITLLLMFPTLGS